MTLLRPCLRSLRCATALLLGLLPSLASALPMPVDDGPVLRIHGSNTVGAKLAPLLVAGLFGEQGLSDVRIVPADEPNEQRVEGRRADGRLVSALIAAHGSSTGFVGLRDGTADIAAASRPIKASELAGLAALGDFKSAEAEQVIAIDGLAIVLHPDNPLSSLDTRTLARLFAGEIGNWSMLGGPDLPVHVHARDENSGTFDTFKELVLAPQSKQLVATAQRYESNDALSAAVAGDTGGIGFVGLASIGRAKAMPIVDGQSQAMAPTPSLIATEDYPLSRRLFFYARPGQRSGWTDALLEYTQSEAGQKLVARSGYVAQTIRAVGQPVQADMPDAYRALAREAERLTVNFRFEEGSAQLDNKAQRDLDRVARYLERHDKLRDHAVLVGFGDAKADPTRASLLSRLRAMTVRRELTKRGVFLRELNGLGDELPVASNEAGSGRLKNRRVEVWVY